LADVVIASADRSAKVLGHWRRDVTVIGNGVDTEMWTLNDARPEDLPKGVIVGYAGKLAHRIDANLVAAVAALMPAVEFVFVGPVLAGTPLSPMRNIRNVHLLGDRRYDELPAYVRNFDVAWIPHRVGDGESGGDPIKLYEYWAAGRPVVSTPIDGMAKWAGSLALAQDPQSAVDAIRRMLTTPVVPPVPPEHKWSAIADRIVAALRE
jgi:glycosyltransferase involved in cell wall biosynthesis